ncbi:MAG TPA: argininosuccinate lyase [Armatimonadota bacterium]|nr:argininosuccinate lyase [Armatimonadota bacterium]
MASKMWGGRFQGGADTLALQYGASLPFDRRLTIYELTASTAHVQMLGEQGILEEREVAEIVDALGRLGVEYADGRFPKEPAEDIHTAVENYLTKLIGPVAGKLHTARSRNDQAATDLHLYVLDYGTRIGHTIRDLQGALVELAEQHVDTIMPGFTHLQPAQPVSLAHHLLAYFWMMERDAGRLHDCLNRSAQCPLGAAALAGTSFPIDRQAVSDELGFDAPYPNSLDAVSDRDFAVELVSFASICMAHLSRLCEEMIIWSSPQFGFMEIADAYATGSSIMPQKKNPDLCELIRGKTGRVYGDLQGLLTMLKGTPLAYNKDFQEDKEAVFDAVDTLLPALTLMESMLRTATWKPERMREAAELGFPTATDVADHLASRGLPFREAHEIVGKLVRLCIERNCALSEISATELRGFSGYFDADYTAPSVDESLAARTSYGGAAPSAVQAQLEEAKAIVKAAEEAATEPDES